MDKLYLSMPERDDLSLPKSMLKSSLVIGAHLAFLLWALQAGGVISHQAMPLPMSVMTVLIAAPSQVVAPENLPKPTAPALHQAAIALPLQPASEQQAMPAAPALIAATASGTTPASTIPTATAAAAAQPAEQRTEASFDAAYLNNPAPAYPLISRRQGEFGKVLLLVQVTPHGTAAQVEIKQSCGFPRLDEAALEAVRKWHFVPARLGDVAVAASVVVPLSFKLNS
ncbi:energy transducer TonB [Undibacterium parvum]|uniref:Energy transducer TonB n=1 Tax=Undibacterium parvum TaxID=401471 RepID=A0A3Q9BS91_9BURK|nr:energy transducer TonB [Undibacterium parvum]AZP12526.1 energy transducer TonB [Undibacterium parvum]